MTKRILTKVVRSKATAKQYDPNERNEFDAVFNFPGEEQLVNISGQVSELQIHLRTLRAYLDYQSNTNGSNDYSQYITKIDKYLGQLDGYISLDDEIKAQELDKLKLIEILEFAGALVIELPVATVLSVFLVAAEFFACVADLCTLLLPKDKPYCQQVWDTMLKSPMEKLDEWIRSKPVDVLGSLVRDEEARFQKLEAKVDKIKNDLINKGVTIPNIDDINPQII